MGKGMDVQVHMWDGAIVPPHSFLRAIIIKPEKLITGCRPFSWSRQCSRHSWPRGRLSEHYSSHSTSSCSRASYRSEYHSFGKLLHRSRQRRRRRRTEFWHQPPSHSLLFRDLGARKGKECWSGSAWGQDGQAVRWKASYLLWKDGRSRKWDERDLNNEDIKSQARRTTTIFDSKEKDYLA